MNEIWKNTSIEHYQVSNLGNIKSVGHYGYSRHKKTKSRWFDEHIITPDCTSGKARVYLSNRKHYMLHVLVAKAFPEICGEWFEGCHVHHKDHNPFNNHADNLLCLTEKEHFTLHFNDRGNFTGEHNPFYGKHHTSKTIRAYKKKNSKPIIQATLDGEEIMCWFSCTDCERDTKMSKASINRVCLGKQKTAYGFKWYYATLPSSHPLQSVPVPSS